MSVCRWGGDEMAPLCGRWDDCVSRHRFDADSASTHRTPVHRAETPVNLVESRRFPAPPANRTSTWIFGLAIGALLVIVLGVHSTSAVDGTPKDYSAANGFGGDSSVGLDDTDVDAGQEISAAEAAKRLSELRASRGKRAAVSTVQWVNPVPSATYTSCFCERWGTFHWGIDLAAPLGTPIGAVGAGVVLKAGPASGFGNAIYIQHENGDVTVYGHMRILEVKAGDIVQPGQEIAKVGTEGFSTGPHLHLEVHVGAIDGEKIDPGPWLAERGIKVGP